MFLRMLMSINVQYVFYIHDVVNIPYYLQIIHFPKSLFIYHLHNNNIFAMYILPYISAKTYKQ